MTTHELAATLRQLVERMSEARRIAHQWDAVGDELDALSSDVLDICVHQPMCIPFYQRVSQNLLAARSLAIVHPAGVRGCLDFACAELSELAARLEKQEAGP